MRDKQIILVSTSLLILLATLSCGLFTPSGGDLKFEPDTLPDAQMATAYEAEVHVTQNRTPVGDFSISKGSLPAGLKLTKIEDEEAGTFTFTVSVWCYGTNVSGQTGEKEYTIVVEG